LPYEDKENMGVSQKGYDAEISSLDILEKEGFEITYSPEKLNREEKILQDKIEKLEIRLDDFGYCSNYVKKKKTESFGTNWYTYRDKRKLVKYKESILNGNQKDDLTRLIKKWESFETQKQNKIKNSDEIKDLINSVVGKFLIPKSSGMGHSMSLKGIDEDYLMKPWNIKFREKNKEILKKEKKIPYVLILTAENMPNQYGAGTTSKIIRIIRPTIKEIEKEKINYKNKGDPVDEGFMDITSTMNVHTYIDVLCKKVNDYYVFDVKHKTFKENKNLNRFYVTNYEVLNYSKIIKENKVKLKIIIIVDKGKKLFYKIFDWMDFHVPTSFDPHKSVKTSIRLKDGLDLVEFKVFPHS
jgi:hypothetical protein